MSQNSIELTATEREQARQQAIKAMRKRLELTKPDSAQYQQNESPAIRMISSTLLWAKAFIPVIALLAAIASAIRTVQTASEIYRAAGSHEIGVIIAALAFTLSAEGALFALALAQEGQRMKWRAEKRDRRVVSLRLIWEGFLVRLGAKAPARYDQLPEGDGIGFVLLIAFSFSVASNAYLGLRPLLAQIGESNLQTFFASLLTAQARLQLQFIVDMAAVLFPPLMALQAGHLTARFFAELAEGNQTIKLAYQRDLEVWNQAYADPLATEQGRELVDQYAAEKLAVKRARAVQKQEAEQQSFLFPLPAQKDRTE